MTDDTTTPEVEETEEREEGFISGLGREEAARALKAAEKAGFDGSVVRTAPFEGGFYAPTEVVKKYEALAKADAKKAEADDSEDAPDAAEQNRILAEETARKQADDQAKVDAENEEAARLEGERAAAHQAEVDAANGVKAAPTKAAAAKTAAK